MNAFSTSRPADEYCAVCEQGNLFYLGNPDNMSCPDLRGVVGGQSTPSLPMCTVETLTNTAPATPSEVMLQINSRPFTLLRGPDDFLQCTAPEQLQVRVGLATTPPPSPQAPPFTPDPAAMAAARGESGAMVPIGRYSSARPDYARGVIAPGHETSMLDVLADQRAHEYEESRTASARNQHTITAFEVDGSAGPPPGGDGTKLVSEMTDAEVAWFSGAIKTFVGTLGSATIGVGDLLANPDHRAFLREMGFTKMRTYTMNGTRMIAFRGNNRLRQLITGTTYGMGGLNGKKITMMNTAFKTPAGNAAAAARGTFSRAGVLGLVFVASLDVAEYYSKPENEQDFSDLVVDLGFSLTIAVVSSIIGAMIAGAALAAITVAVPVALIVAAGIGASIIVGWAISALVDASGLKDGIKDAVNNAEAPRNDVYQSMMTAP